MPPPRLDANTRPVAVVREVAHRLAHEVQDVQHLDHEHAPVNSQELLTSRQFSIPAHALLAARAAAVTAVHSLATLCVVCVLVTLNGAVQSQRQHPVLWQDRMSNHNI
eukprot:366131-Chlamydomonas_euryale.AAC.25